MHVPLSSPRVVSGELAERLNIDTGVEGTPVALLWTLNPRMHLHGEIAKIKELVADAPANIARLQAKLTTLDDTVGMHQL